MLKDAFNRLQKQNEPVILDVKNMAGLMSAAMGVLIGGAFSISGGQCRAARRKGPATSVSGCA